MNPVPTSNLDGITVANLHLITINNNEQKYHFCAAIGGLPVPQGQCPSGEHMLTACHVCGYLYPKNDEDYKRVLQIEKKIAEGERRQDGMPWSYSDMPNCVFCNIGCSNSNCSVTNPKDTKRAARYYRYLRESPAGTLESCVYCISKFGSLVTSRGNFDKYFKSLLNTAIAADQQAQQAGCQWNLNSCIWNNWNTTLLALPHEVLRSLDTSEVRGSGKRNMYGAAPGKTTKELAKQAALASFWEVVDRLKTTAVYPGMNLYVYGGLTPIPYSISRSSLPAHPASAAAGPSSHGSFPRQVFSPELNSDDEAPQMFSPGSVQIPAEEFQSQRVDVRTIKERTERLESMMQQILSLSAGSATGFNGGYMPQAVSPPPVPESHGQAIPMFQNSQINGVPINAIPSAAQFNNNQPNRPFMQGFQATAPAQFQQQPQAPVPAAPVIPMGFGAQQLPGDVSMELHSSFKLEDLDPSLYDDEFVRAIFPGISNAGPSNYQQPQPQNHQVDNQQMQELLNHFFSPTQRGATRSAVRGGGTSVVKKEEDEIAGDVDRKDPDSLAVDIMSRLQISSPPTTAPPSEKSPVSASDPGWLQGVPEIAKILSKDGRINGNIDSKHTWAQQWDQFCRKLNPLLSSMSFQGKKLVRFFVNNESLQLTRGGVPFNTLRFMADSNKRELDCDIRIVNTLMDVIRWVVLACEGPDALVSERVTEEALIAFSRQLESLGMSGGCRSQVLTFIVAFLGVLPKYYSRGDDRAVSAKNIKDLYMRSCVLYLQVIRVLLKKGTSGITDAFRRELSSGLMSATGTAEELEVLKKVLAQIFNIPPSVKSED